MAFGHQREQGRRILLREIERRGPIPRIDLSHYTGISRATVTTVTAELLRDGLIQEIPRDSENAADLKRGRPRVDLKIAGAAHLVAGIKVSDRSVSLMLVDFEGTQLAELEVPFAKGPASSQELTDNDANLVAMAEKTFGLGRDHSDFIVVTIESGVGMGIVLNGQIYRGTRGCGAEFGHTKVQLEGALCRCGQRGCLEAYVADYALVREAASVGFLDPDLPIENRVKRLLQAAKEGDPTAKTIVTRAGRMFAIGLANLVNVFDPQLIILAGEQMQFDHLYAQEVIEEMRKSIVQIDKPPPDVLIHRWDNLMWARGAAAYALDFVFDMAIRDVRDDLD